MRDTTCMTMLTDYGFTTPKIKLSKNNDFTVINISNNKDMEKVQTSRQMERVQTRTLSLKYKINKLWYQCQNLPISF